MQRHNLIQKIKILDPKYVAPPDYRPPEVKYIDKVPIPQDDFPNVSFMGQLIGPRGTTLKAIQKETRCKVMIRGRGTEKAGRGRRDGRAVQGEGEGMHAIVEGPNAEWLDKGCKKILAIIKLAVATPDGQNELKRQQLRELAAINGTLRDDEKFEVMKQNHVDRQNLQETFKQHFTNEGQAAPDKLSDEKYDAEYVQMHGGPSPRSMLEETDEMHHFRRLWR